MPPGRFASLACLLALARPAPVDGAGGERQAGDVRLPVSRFQLENGLTVLLHEDHTVPVVAVNLSYRVGSQQEKPGRTGFAHLFEHLMFQGSAHVADDQHLALIAAAGGSANATTSEDRTTFFETLPANYLELALFLESDRMGFLLDALTQAKLDTQRAVVQNERRESFENRPYGMAGFAVREALYPAGHPYRHLPIGSHADLEAATLDDVKEFFRAWYTPGNAVLCLAGDFDAAQARALVRKYFAPLPSHPTPARVVAGELALAASPALAIEDQVSFERLYLAWPSPRWFAAGDAELDLLATVLGSKSGRLYQRLVYELRLAQSVVVAQSSSLLGSQFLIVATAQTGHGAAELSAALTTELQRLLGTAPLRSDELARARNAWEAQFVYGLEGYERRAEAVAQYFEVAGAEGFERDRRRYVGATVEGVMRVAREVLGGHRVALVVKPARGSAQAPASPAVPALSPAAEGRP